MAARVSQPSTELAGPSERRGTSIRCMATGPPSIHQPARATLRTCRFPRPRRAGAHWSLVGFGGHQYARHLRPHPRPCPLRCPPGHQGRFLQGYRLWPLIELDSKPSGGRIEGYGVRGVQEAWCGVQLFVLLAWFLRSILISFWFCMRIVELASWSVLIWAFCISMAFSIRTNDSPTLEL